jgi:dienelactone hydrolase
MKHFQKLFVLLLAVGMLFVFTACEPSGVSTYDISSANTGIGVSSARVFYPSGIGSLSNVGATTLSSGMGGSKEGMYWLARPLAEAGIVVLAISASNNMYISGYETAHRRGLTILSNENSRTGSPIRGKLGQRGLIGYSKGGGAVLNVASALGTQVRTCVALAPYSPSVRSGHRAATMILTGTTDTIAPARMGSGAYNDIPSGVPKLYASMRGEGHMYWNNLSRLGSETDFMRAWLKYYLENNQSYYSVFSNGPGSGMTDYRFDDGSGSGGCD